MSQPFFKIPFASSGDTVVIPSTVQVSGAVSYPQGFGPDYQLSNSDIGVLYPERPVMNELFNVIMLAVQYLQVHGFPDFITTSDNGGSPYSYDKNSCVRYGGVVYYSLVDTNTALPSDATKWTPLFPTAAFKTGMTIIHEDTSLPDSTWVWANGQTIGNASSNASGRANADTAALFAQIWNAFPQAVRPMVNNSGVPTARGANAAADFAANRAIPLRDMRGNVPAGLTTMGGTTSSGNLAQVNSLGVDGTIFGATGGEGLGHTPTVLELVPHSHSNTLAVGNTALSTTQVPPHKHFIADANSINGDSGATPLSASNTTAYQIQYSGGILSSQFSMSMRAPTGGGSPTIGLTSVPQNSGSADPHTHGITGAISNTGSGNAFNVVQPTTICNFITKL